MLFDTDRDDKACTCTTILLGHWHEMSAIKASTDTLGLRIPEDSDRYARGTQQ